MKAALSYFFHGGGPQGVRYRFYGEPAAGTAVKEGDGFKTVHAFTGVLVAGGTKGYGAAAGERNHLGQNEGLRCRRR